MPQFASRQTTALSSAAQPPRTASVLAALLAVGAEGIVSHGSSSFIPAFRRRPRRRPVRRCRTSFAGQLCTGLPTASWRQLRIMHATAVGLSAQSASARRVFNKASCAGVILRLSGCRPYRRSSAAAGGRRGGHWDWRHDNRLRDRLGGGRQLPRSPQSVIRLLQVQFAVRVLVERLNVVLVQLAQSAVPAGRALRVPFLACRSTARQCGDRGTPWWLLSGRCLRGRRRITISIFPRLQGGDRLPRAAVFRPLQPIQPAVMVVESLAVPGAGGALALGQVVQPGVLVVHHGAEATQLAAEPEDDAGSSQEVPRR